MVKRRRKPCCEPRVLPVVWVLLEARFNCQDLDEIVQKAGDGIGHKLVIMWVTGISECLQSILQLRSGGVNPGGMIAIMRYSRNLLRVTRPFIWLL